jgi:hypothetical protein
MWQFLQQVPSSPKAQCGFWASKRSKAVSMPIASIRSSTARTPGSGVWLICSALLGKRCLVLAMMP